jgi:hypothetical protein
MQQQESSIHNSRSHQHAIAGVINMQKHFHTTAEAFNLQQQETSTCNSRIPAQTGATQKQEPCNKSSSHADLGAMQTATDL